MPERTDEDTSQQVESLTPQAGPNEDEAIQGGSVSGVEEEIRWHRERHQAETASKLAFLLVWILASSFAIHYGATLVLSSLDRTEAADVLSSAFNVWLPVISGLVGGAVTYYFTKERR